MDNDSTLNSLLEEYHLMFIWDEKIKCWWLEGTDFTNRQWQSPIFNVPNEKEALSSAIKYIQSEAAGRSE